QNANGGETEREAKARTGPRTQALHGCSPPLQKVSEGWTHSFGKRRTMARPISPRETPRVLDLEEDPPSVEQARDGNPEPAIGPGKEEGGEARIAEVIEDRAVDRGVQGAALAVGARDLDPDQEDRQEVRGDEEKEGVRAQPPERRRPGDPALSVHDPEEDP